MPKHNSDFKQYSVQEKLSYIPNIIDSQIIKNHAKDQNVGKE